MRRIPAAGALATIGIIVAAIVSAAIYVHDVSGRLEKLETQVTMMSQQLKRVTPVTTKWVESFNGRVMPQCDIGSFMAGVQITVHANGSASGTLLCAKAQPASSN
jgi:ABC-type phosphate transport system substrate-binding protein